MAPNFDQCGATFQSNLSLYENYIYNGTVDGTWKDTGDAPALMTLSGCYALCGTGPEYYTWAAASGTILTWVLPVIGLLVLAPFESNAKKQTLLLMCRYVGSPLASLSYILWNIKVTGKCALMIDMASDYDVVPGPNTAFGNMRDSLYLLGVMNQYSLRPGIPQVEAEKLLRIALFSDTLKLAADEQPNKTLPARRRKLARSLRTGRKQGAVPVFLSSMWFMFAMGVSIETAFGDLGANATAHNLAMGLMLAWFPVIILCGIVDLSPGASGEVRLRLNHLLDQVRTALLDENLATTYIKQSYQTPEDLQWTDILREHRFLGESGFFTGFAGQGRVRWHRGVAHPVLTGIEEAFVAHKGRGWLGKTPDETWQSINAVVLGPNHGDHLQGLKYFDPRELLAVTYSLFIVSGSIIGAFIISYFTPTIGLGCRSGGYTIFAIIDFTVALIEGLAWWLLPEALPNSRRRSYSTESSLPLSSEKQTIGSRLLMKPLQLWNSIREALYNNPRRLIEVCVLIPMEIVNSCWLVYIILAQTFGIYNTCFCQASTWGGRGGYINFEDDAYYKAHGVVLYWAIGTAISCSVMLLTISYVLKEWCVQSHLNTSNYTAAARGLRRTRTFRKYTQFLSIPKNAAKAFLKLLSRMAGTKGRLLGRRSLVWTSKPNKEVWNGHGFVEERVLQSIEGHNAGSGNASPSESRKKEPSVKEYIVEPGVEVDDEISES